MKSVQMILSACCFGVLLLAGCTKDNTTDCSTNGNPATCLAAGGCYWNAPASGVGPAACVAATACSQFSGSTKAICEANNFSTVNSANNNRCVYAPPVVTCSAYTCAVNTAKTGCCNDGTANCPTVDAINCTATGTAPDVTACTSAATKCTVVADATATVCCAAAQCSTADVTDPGCKTPSTLLAATCN